MGKMAYYVPFTFEDRTFLHTVSVASIKELCILSLDFLKATGCVIDLSLTFSRELEMFPPPPPIKVAASAELQVKRVHVFKGIVIATNSVGYIRGNLEIKLILLSNLIKRLYITLVFINAGAA